MGEMLPPAVARSITAALTGIWAGAFGKGPDAARTYLNDDNIVVVFHGGLLVYEQTLIEAGDREAVRTVRYRFEQHLAPQLIRAVEAATGRRVAAYDSHMLFGPTRTFELFVVEDADGRRADATAP